MTVGHVLHHEAELYENFFRLPDDALAVLQRAGGMIGDDKSWRVARGLERQAGEIFRDVLGQT